MSRAQRDARAVVEMREGRRILRQIGDTLGVSMQRAHQIYREAIASHPLAASAIDEHIVCQLYDEVWPAPQDHKW